MFRILAAVVFAWLMMPPAFADDPPLDARWNKSTEIYTRKGETWFLSEIFGNTYTGQFIPAPCATQGQWCTVDFKPGGVGADAKAVFVQGLLIITSGSTVQTADLHLSFRRPGDTSVNCVNQYMAQAVIATITGERTNFSSWLPVVDGKLEFCWTRNTPDPYPANSAYGFNMGAQAWVK